MRNVTLLLAIVLVLGASAPAFAGAFIDWDPIFTWEPGATATNSPIGGELRGVGIISAFDDPFGDLDANDPTTEYTIYIYGAISQGTVTVGPPANEFYTTNYTGGFIEIYEGSPRNAVYTPNPPNADVPSTFTDGTLLLSGQFQTLFTQTNNFTAFQTGNMEGTVLWTGGTRLSDLNNGNGEPCEGLFTGGITWRSDVVPAGYIFRHDGKIDNNCPVPVENATWGRIKQQYR